MRQEESEFSFWRLLADKFAPNNLLVVVGVRTFDDELIDPRGDLFWFGAWFKSFDRQKAGCSASSLLGCVVRLAWFWFKVVALLVSGT